MAGLQQYNFFPTDFFYPRPQPSSAKPTPTVLPIQTSATEDLQNQNQQQQQATSLIKVPPSAPALVYAQKRQPLTGIDKMKLSKFNTDPLSWVVWMAEEEEEGSDLF